MKFLSNKIFLIIFQELKRKSTARIELSNSVARHLHQLDPVSSRSESRVETSLITCAAINVSSKV